MPYDSLLNAAEALKNGKIDNFEEENEVFKTCVYERKDLLIQRSLVWVKNKKSGVVQDDFYDVHMDSKKALVGTGYFFKNEAGYESIVSTFGNQILDPLSLENNNSTISFDKNGYAQIKNFLIRYISQDKYYRGDLIYSEDLCIYQGISTLKVIRSLILTILIFLESNNKSCHDLRQKFIE